MLALVAVSVDTAFHAARVVECAARDNRRHRAHGAGDVLKEDLKARAVRFIDGFAQLSDKKLGQGHRALVHGRLTSGWLKGSATSPGQYAPRAAA